MPWWSWVLIWLGLVLAMLAMLAWFAWKLFKKLMVAVSALEELAVSLEPLSRVAPPEPAAAWRSSLFKDIGAVQARHDEEREKRDERRDARRQHRIMRGKLLVRADYREFSHLTKRT